MFQPNSSKVNLFSFLTFLICVSNYTSAIPTCSTPAEWLDGDTDARYSSNDASAKLFKTKLKWPGGLIKYKLNFTLTKANIRTVMSAMEEYHAKTCVRFEPWKSGDRHFVSIERDDSVCGFANVCMKQDAVYGYQFARFGNPMGQRCTNKATMVHELGHTICLGHEHQRQDRDNYVSFDGCPEIPRKSKRALHHGIYDFDSQMHYPCNGCQGGLPKPPYDVYGCGDQTSDGLSVMDADTINQLYNCQGCYRHRWIPIETLTANDIENLPDFGTSNITGPLNPCRAAINNEILVGMFEKVDKLCIVLTQKWGVEIVQKNVEVLTIPGDLSPTVWVTTKNNQFHYFLKKYKHISPTMLAKHAIPAGKYYVKNTVPMTSYVEVTSLPVAFYVELKALERRKLKWLANGHRLSNILIPESILDMNHQHIINYFEVQFTQQHEKLIAEYTEKLEDDECKYIEEYNKLEEEKRRLWEEDIWRLLSEQRKSREDYISNTMKRQDDHWEQVIWASGTNTVDTASIDVELRKESSKKDELIRRLLEERERLKSEEVEWKQLEANQEKVIDDMRYREQIRRAEYQLQKLLTKRKLQEKRNLEVNELKKSHKQKVEIQMRKLKEEYLPWMEEENKYKEQLLQKYDEVEEIYVIRTSWKSSHCVVDPFFGKAINGNHHEISCDNQVLVCK